MVYDGGLLSQVADVCIHRVEMCRNASSNGLTSAMPQSIRLHAAVT